MRSTVNFPASVDRRARALAAASGKSLSAVYVDLVLRGLSQLDEPIALAINPESGFAVLSIGRRLTSSEVAELLDE